MQEEEERKTFLLGASLDRLVRLFDIGTPYANGQRRRGNTLCSYFTGVENAIAMAAEKTSFTVHREPTEEEADEENLWTNMAVVSEQANNDESDEDSHKEKRSKRGRS